MMKWTLACAVVLVAGLLAEQAQAQTQTQTPAQAVIPATVINSSEIIAPAPRTGLFGRLRERRGMTTTVNQPILQAQAIEPQAIAAQPTPSGVQQVQATESVAMPVTAAVPATIVTPDMQVVEQRQGLLARLRARRGR